MDHPDLTVSNFMENPIGFKRGNEEKNSMNRFVTEPV